HGGAAVAILGVVVVRARLGVRVLNLPGWWGRGLARRVLVGGGEAGAERDVVGAGAALHRLVEVIAHRVVLGQVGQDRRVTLGRVADAGLQPALEDRGRRDRAVVVAGGVGYPGEQAAVMRRGLLPHLVEAVQRVTGEVAGELAAAGVLGVIVVVGHVLGDLVRPVGQRRGEPGVGAVSRQAGAAGRDVGRVGLGERLVGAGDPGGQGVGLGVAGGELGGLAEVRARRAVRGDDALGAKVPDPLPGGRLVGGEDVVEGVVLTDDHDHVLDGGRGRGGVTGAGGGGRRAGGG